MRVCEWDRTNVGSRVESVPYEVVMPYSTWELDGSLVVQVMVMDEEVTDEVAMERIVGAMTSPVLLTVTDMGVEVAGFPLESLATATREWEPLDDAVVSQFMA